MSIERKLDNEKTDKVIRGLGNFFSDLECSIHEGLYPKPEIQEEDEVKQIIKEMLCENTGCDICDSGGAYGRYWERNRGKDFDKEDAIRIEVWPNETFMLTYDVYHYLTNFLEVTEETKKLQKVLEEYVNREESSSYLQDMEDFMKYLVDEHDFESLGITNTYNYDNILSQGLQYGIVENEEGCCIVLQTHNGCDQRGGYSVPKMFSLGEDGFDYFSMAQSDIYAVCEKCGMRFRSDDSGYHFYGDGCGVPNLEVGIEQEDKLNIKTDEANNKIYHKNCGGEIDFSVIEDY